MLRSRFEGFCFFVFEAENGAEGLKVLRTQSITFVLSDLQMPKMDGIEFLKKAREQFPALQIFIMKGFSPYSEKDILDFGATGYFEKTSIDVRKIAPCFRKDVVRAEPGIGGEILDLSESASELLERI